MSKQFTHIKINPLGFMLDESFDKNMQEALRQKQVAESAPDLLEALKATHVALKSAWDNGTLPASVIPASVAQDMVIAIHKAEGKA